MNSDRHEYLKQIDRLLLERDTVADYMNRDFVILATVLIVILGAISSN